METKSSRNLFFHYEIYFSTEIKYFIQEVFFPDELECFSLFLYARCYLVGFCVQK